MQEPPVVEEPVEIEEPVVETNEVVEVVEEPEPVEEVIDTNVTVVAEVAEETEKAGGLNLQKIIMAVFGGILLVLVVVVIIKKVKGGQDHESPKATPELASAAAPVGMEDKEVDMSGHIASSSLGDVSQFLNAGKETGVLSIKNEESDPMGRMVFDKGELVDAESPGHCGVEAVYDLLRHKDGFFSFVRQAEESITERTITQGTISLLLDVYRVIDEENSEKQQSL